MRITHDKNGEPFGYCEHGCKQQLRIGGKAERVQKFLARFPWAARATEPVSATAPAPAPAPAPAAKPAPAPASKPKSANPFDFLLNQGAKA